MKILIGVDESEQSKQAVETVRRLSWPKDTHVVVVSVVKPILTAYPEIYAVVSKELMEAEAQFKQRQQKLAEDAAARLSTSGLGAEIRVPLGDPRSVLVELAKDEHVDLIAVGSHGRTGLSKLLLGSVASYVVTHASCSVLVVKHAAT
jgi:nucleotide-binding universal stress UspA family protein